MPDLPGQVETVRTCWRQGHSATKTDTNGILGKQKTGTPEQDYTSKPGKVTYAETGTVIVPVSFLNYSVSYYTEILLNKY